MTGRLLAAKDFGFSIFTRDGAFMVGAFSWVITTRTPRAAFASDRSNATTRPLAIVLHTRAAYATCSTSNSAAKCAPPVTLSTPSTRFTLFPMYPCVWPNGSVAGSGAYRAVVSLDDWVTFIAHLRVRSVHAAHR